MPIRIQRKRSRGWRMPLCSCGCGQKAISVSRPGRWGNPFTVNVPFCGPTIRQLYSAAEVVAAYRDLMTRPEVHPLCWERRFVDARQYFNENLAKLTGHDLVFWCPLDQECHGDVLLQLSNTAKGER